MDMNLRVSTYYSCHYLDLWEGRHIDLIIFILSSSWMDHHQNICIVSLEPMQAKEKAVATEQRRIPVQYLSLVHAVGLN
jgi:hypothetical protein